MLNSKVTTVDETNHSKVELDLEHNPNLELSAGVSNNMAVNKVITSSIDLRAMETNEAHTTVAVTEGSLRCTCGCVPNVMSLFEMAALRAEHRKKMKALTNDK